jgi:hypothetical protein
MKTQVVGRVAPGPGRANGPSSCAPGELEFRVSGDQLTVQLQEVCLCSTSLSLAP